MDFVLVFFMMDAMIDQKHGHQNDEPKQYDEVIAHCKKNGWTPDSEPPLEKPIPVSAYIEDEVLRPLATGTARFGWQRVFSNKIIDPKKNHTYMYYPLYPKSKQITLVKDGKSKRNYVVYPSPVVSAKGETKSVFSFSRKSSDFQVAVVFQKTIEISDGKKTLTKWYTADFATVFFDQVKR